MSSALLTKHYLISGRVQGVGFRAFVYSCASQLQLRGWVRNLEDGRVEAVVCGRPEDVVIMSAQLRKGPARGRVDAMLVSDHVEENLEPTFVIRKDGVKPCNES